MRKYVVVVREGEAEVHRQVLFVGTYTFRGDLQNGHLVETQTEDVSGLPERSA
jgi:hypothetical protein